LLKKARSEAKEDEGLRLLRAMEMRNQTLEASFTRGGSSVSAASRSPQQQQQQQQRQQPSQQQQQRGHRSMTESQQRHSVKWVDGSVYDASLAGTMAPDPSIFPMAAKFKLDAVNGGVVHDASNCSIVCSGCAQLGHQFSECPAREWQQGGQKYVNFRWLYASKFCKADGKPC
jgi:hypothetical protein